MTSDQALSNIDQAVSIAPLTRQQHGAIIESLKLIAEELARLKKLEDVKE